MRQITYRAVFILLLTATVVGGCGDDKSTEPPGYAKLIVGSWEWVYVVEGEEIEYMDEDQLFWVFTAGGKYCNPGIDHDSIYYVSCRGSYTITPTLLTIDCPSGTHVEVDYLFSPQGDTLYCGRLFDAEIALKRVDDPPEYGGCN